ncbi:MAG: SDR family oxidoreductase [Candidatus Hodarchaeota archaeon]
MNIVITGSTKGIGYALAKEFLKHGDNVIISSRDEEKVINIIQKLKEHFPNNRIDGITCDVRIYHDVEKLAERSQELFKSIDIWINNAGTNAYINANLVDFDPEALKEIVNTNLLGTIYGCKAALKLMIPQNHGRIFNIEGYGSNGRVTPMASAYGATKAAIPQLTKTLSKEAEGTRIGIHTINPGMVITDLLAKDVPPEAVKIFNILAELPDNIAKFLVPRMKEIKGTNKHISFLKFNKTMYKFMTAGKRKYKFFDKEGNLRKEFLKYLSPT